MCGISCIINKKDSIPFTVLKKYNDSIAHRGPDGYGFATFAYDNGNLQKTNSSDFNVGFGHRRLSILDLSEAGSQPMFSADENHLIVYNGEVYNYLEIREELKKEGVTFKSNTDTEVVLEAYRKWGKSCLQKFNGMWALLILDIKKRKIFISRDRIGIKPVYYYIKNGTLSIASEIKQFFQLPDFKSEPNKNACLSYLITGYEIPPETFFRDVFVFPPGHYAEINIDETPEIRPLPYWSAESIKIEQTSQEDASEEINKIFSDAVKLRLRSDVPVGGCLSGGLDSSAIFVEMGNMLENGQLSAFSACFNDPRIDERPFMKTIVETTRSKHIQIFPDENGLLEDINAFLKQHDEPVGSISMYAQYKVMEAARKNEIPVLLDGQGGDELFSGYWTAYMHLMHNYKRNSRYSQLLSNASMSILPGGNSHLISQSFSMYKEYRKRAERKLPYQIKASLTKQLDGISALQWVKKATDLNPMEYRIAEITKIHLPRLLKWEDRNSMAFSIESRVPFLDKNLLEKVLSIKPEMNMKSGWTKYLFRKSMSKTLPANICWRKDKKGFETPQEKWMKRGLFNSHLRNWTAEKEHPVSQFIDSDFSSINKTLDSASFDSTQMFRLYCLDKWLKDNT